MWQIPPAVALGLDEVHVWQAQLDVSTQDLATYQGSLNADESARAQRLHNPIDRRRFIARRGILRHLLGSYLGILPAEIYFTYTAYGKPELSVPNDRSALHFTLAHSSGQALYAVNYGRAIGIDIEHIQRSFDHEQIAGTLFAAEERAFLCTLPPAQRTTAFFRLWACKEAYIKACSLGLSLLLNTFAIALETDQPARVLYGHHQSSALRLNLRELPIDEDYVAALAVEGDNWQVRCWRIPEIANTPFDKPHAV